MSKLRRYFSGNPSFFITCVTHERREILLENADLLHRAITKTRERVSFNTVSWVILPDHFHAILDTGGNNLSSIMQRLKQSFSMNFRMRSSRTGRVWQLRFWDHAIRDQNDLNRHIDYIHFNPVRHGLVSVPGVHPESSFHDYVVKGYYQEDWGTSEPIPFEGEYGE